MLRTLLSLLFVIAVVPGGQAAVLDDFSSAGDWIAEPSDGVSLKISTSEGIRGRAMRLDYDFHGGGGYAIARKPVSLKLPADYEFSFHIRGEGPTNTLEFKLLDPSGENVWWQNRRNFAFPSEWTRMRIKKRHLEFAWGPSAGAPLTEISALEIVITASSGVRGTVWIDELAFEERAPRPATWPTPVARASSFLRGHDASDAVDANPSTSWRATATPAQTLTLDFSAPREFGGLTMQWEDGAHAVDYDVAFSDDGRSWTSAVEVSGSNGGRDPLFLPDSDARYVRIRMQQAAGSTYALRELTVEPLEFSASRNAFFARLAAAAPPGRFPKYLGNVQSYWTVVGETNDEREALINEEGMIELDRSTFSIEPFLFTDGKLITWNDVTRTQSLAAGYLPVPSVDWSGAPIGLQVTLFAREDAMYARYRLTNPTTSDRDATLFVALRPFQVNPPWQFLNVPGGTSPIHDIAFENDVVRAERRRIVAITPASGFGATTFASGDVTEWLARGALPDAKLVHDSFGAASGALRWDVRVPANATTDVWLQLPDDETASRVTVAEADALHANALRAWHARLARFTLELPEGLPADVARVVMSNTAYILINQDGPAIQPGSRSYDRSWIRDGSLTSAALLRLGYVDNVRDFADWFAPFQFPTGKVPCCVDERGADPVPEHDSSGEFIYLLAEYYRHTKDLSLLQKHWPRVEKAIEWLDSLTKQRMTDEYRTPEKRAYFGMVPESISHEGYSAKPMHSYWDNFFTLLGFEDAAMIAGVLKKPEAQRACETLASTFRTNLYASLAETRRMHGIAYIPGSVELGDFDATSTTTALAPGGQLENIDRAALAATFDRYYTESISRVQRKDWEAYTPYETRTIGSFVRLGQRERALTLLEFFMKDLRPRAWNHWAEVVFRDPATPKFIGDMPHTWVGSDFIRSVLDMFAYEDEHGAIVVGAGIPEAWTEGTGVRLRGLRTHYGLLDVSMRRENGSLRVEINGTARPPAGVIVKAPGQEERRVETIPAVIVY